ncbi:hypothetical protein CJ030_MR7G011383 [Morella rubra]|uniref:RNase H type-1 domain-containing protein n=1 Tax=Morella rubra TaxID=262757 RepID=A0A6A1V2X1_9ROSI|nr:hypothetical protein CJ030_MR7G011383 [Morella rubra]
MWATLALDTIWWFRNKSVHQGLKVDPFEALSTVRRRFIEHIQAWQILETDLKRRWTPPPLGSWKINVDAACRTWGTAISAIYRDDAKKILHVWTDFTQNKDPTWGEVKAINLACCMGQKFGWQHIIIETDN